VTASRRDTSCFALRTEMRVINRTLASARRQKAQNA